MDGYNKRTIHYGIICALIALLFYSGAVLDQKIVKIFIFKIPAAAWFFISIYPLCDAITEVYGPKKTWHYLIAGYLVCCVFMALTIFTIHMPYANFENASFAREVYSKLELAMLKCFGLGYTIFFIGMFINVKLLGKWKLKYNGKHYYSRSYIASAISEGFVVITANILIWLNRISWQHIFYLIITTYFLKLILTFWWVLLGVFMKNTFYLLEGTKKFYIYNDDFYNQLKELNG